MKLKLIVSVLVVWVLGAGPAPAQQPPIRLGLELSEGKTLVFLGDSITHQCLYTQYVEDYFYTRYPGKRLRFRNAGVSGDRAANALDRFQEDVAAHQPEIVTILLGMNDGRYGHFSHEIFDLYQRDMQKLLEEIKNTGAQAVPMGPSLFDTRVALSKPPPWIKEPAQQQAMQGYYNAVLAFYSAWLRDTANRQGLGHVDLLGPMSTLSQKRRADNANFTLIDDAVHPGTHGQAVMAVEILRQMGVSREVAAIRVDVRNGNAQAAGGKLDALSRSGEKFSFGFEAECLPWAVPADAAAGFALAGGAELSEFFLQVKGLEAGMYSVQVDGQEIGRFSDLDLTAGIQMQSLAAHPDVRQAVQVAQFNQKRNHEQVRPLRDQWLQYRGKRGLAQSDPAAFEAWKKEFDEKTAGLEAEARKLEDQIHEMAQPRLRRYELVRVPENQQ